MTMQKGIDICICTFNRVNYLRQCVELLLPQLNHPETLLTIINNNSTDSTEAYVKSVMEQNGSIRYFFEPRQGLSHARNRGLQESLHDWIFYMDDDSLPPNEILKSAELRITKHSYLAAIGGPVFTVFSSIPPAWLPDKAWEFQLPYQEFTIIDKGYLRGPCFLVKRNIIKELEGF